jgi:hypothetical protein
VPRFFAVPGNQEVVTRTEYATVPQVISAPAAVNTALPQVAVAAPTAIAAIPQTQATVAVMPQQQVALATAAPQTPVSVMPQTVPATVTPLSPAQTVAIQAAATPQAPSCQPPITREQIQALGVKVEMLEKILKAQEEQGAGTPNKPATP